MKKVLITGAAGFIGSHVVEHLLGSTDWELILVDRLAYASNGLSRLKEIGAYPDTTRTRFHATDISYPIQVGLEKEVGMVDYVLHLAAETHVENSILDPRPFVQSNVLGTMEMLQFARRMNSQLQKFVYMSTDEVFGPAPKGVRYQEWDRYNSTNPYAATKAAGEELALAWANTYGIPLAVVHCMNAFGERQHPEKYIPLIVKKILSGALIHVHADQVKRNPGARHYIHARNVASALQFVLERVEAGYGKLRDKYNIVGEKEVDNMELVKTIHRYMERALGQKFELKCELVDFHSSRPGHDLRYSLNGDKMKQLGWEPPKNFEASLEKTVGWMVDQRNIKWLFVD